MGLLDHMVVYFSSNRTILNPTNSAQKGSDFSTSLPMLGVFLGCFVFCGVFCFVLFLRFPFKSWNLISGSQISCLSLELMLQEILGSSTFSRELTIFPSLSFGAFMSAVAVCKSLWVVTATMKVKDTCSLGEKL